MPPRKKPIRGGGQTGKRYGKYRGKVVNTTDPMLLGRVRVQVPEALGGEGSVWAVACVPCGGTQALPPVGAEVWVEFEAGDVSRPIWTGCTWNRQPAAGLSLRDHLSQLIVLFNTHSHPGQMAGSVTVTSAPPVPVIMPLPPE